MADVVQPATPTPPKKRRILRNALLTLLIVIIFLVAALGVMFTTDRGSKFLLDRVMERQHIFELRVRWRESFKRYYFKKYLGETKRSGRQN